MGFGFGPGFGGEFAAADTGFRVMRLVVTGGIVLILCAFAVMILLGLLEWNRNNRAPRRKLPAQITGKRTELTGHSHGDRHLHTTTWHYVTFQLESGERMEFSLSGQEYGLLAEGDRGMLAFQGTRYLSFERSI